ncbi:2-dehydro-3-deoxygluconokinase [Vibrio cholerae]|uniref:sugar kinase n=1 Tax=Vibrio cholerae TaxID=666 RepID=UPI0011EC70ED|nr:sugar kinase [Vibrio cholerae]EGQ8493496.1 sugar kinase [Vibrio cholerae]EGR3933632.1 sugar kinase [Vibrio cholerae]EGR4059264.1 sugar kinase [Vibrio cholerae]EGR4154878.1 sugar kinase [Vibrio cholerae]EGR4416925.1 sugar kinase [Vibrio cholerae]
MKVNRVAVIGECMVELQKTDDQLKQSFGGDTLNTALYLSRLTQQHGVTTAYVTGLGKDPFSKEMLANWQQEGINTDLVQISDNKLPGIYAIETAADGERSFFYWRNDSAAKYWLRDGSVESFAAALSQNQVIYLSGISLAILPTDCREKLVELLTLCRKDGVKVAFDDNFRPALWESLDAARDMYASILRLTDIAFLTFDDEVMLYGDSEEQQAIERTQAFGVKEIVVKRGAQECYVVTPNDFIAVPAVKVSNVVDTTAAGDSFSAGYLAKRLTGGSTVDSAVAGHTLAGTVIQHRGAIIPRDAMPLI